MAMRRPPLARAAFAAAVLVVVAGAAAVRLWSPPGADLDSSVQETLGRAPRLDAYWYTRAAVDAARGEPRAAVPETFDRPLYTAWCRAVFAASGTSEAAVALPSIAAAALSAGLLVLVGLACGLGRAALLTGVFAATSWIAVLHDREPLVYATVNLAFLAAFLAWTRAIRRPRWLPAAWAAVASVVVSGKETVLLAVPALLAGHVLLARGSAREKARAAAVAAAAVAAASLLAWWLLPDLAAAAAHKVAARSSLLDLPFPSGWVIALGDLPRTLAAIGKVPALAVLAAVGIVAVALEGRPPERDEELVLRRVLALWLLTGCLVVAGFSYRPTRYVLGLSAPAFLLAAHGARVLWGSFASPVRLGAAARAAVLGLAWWLGFAALYAWVVDLLPASTRAGVPPLLLTPAFRLGAAAALATATALAQAAALGTRDVLRAAPRWAVALVAFVLVSDARALAEHCRPVRFDDLAARRSFEAVVGPGARVRGYAAHYLAFAPRYRVTFDFDVRPASLLGDRLGSTHLATLWIPELDYVEREMAAAGSPLHRVVDVVVGRERYRVYRLPQAESLGYRLTAFEAARALEDGGEVAGAAAAYRALVAAGASDPVVLAAAGAAISRVAPAEGLPLLERAATAAPRNGVVHLVFADAAVAAGAPALAPALLSRAAALLPHELVLGLGAPPRTGAY